MVGARIGRQKQKINRKGEYKGRGENKIEGGGGGGGEEDIKNIRGRNRYFTPGGRVKI